ncbi:hypothetical protein LTR49_025771 [Elasticomyces elasticus]|nr:hypothetical protein LTR49_025771 [Elasticomyces elasticus]
MTIKQDGPEPAGNRDSNNIYVDAHNDDIINNILNSERDGAFVPEVDEHHFQVRKEPHGTKRPVRVALMGAGASTVNFLKKAEAQLENVMLIVYEKNHDVGEVLQHWPP